MTLSELFGNDDMTPQERAFLEAVSRSWAKRKQSIIKESKKAKK